MLLDAPEPKWVPTVFSRGIHAVVPQNVMSRSNDLRRGRRFATGIDGFDAISDGGLPRAGITVVLGGAGAGKTLFGMQVLANGAALQGEPGILVTFEESAAQVLANTAGLTWGGSALEGKALHVVDAQLSQSTEQAGEFDLIGLLATVAAKAKAASAQRIVFDGIDILLVCLRDPALIRREIFRLREWVYASGVSLILTAKADAREGRASADYDFLEFLADCVVTLHHRVNQGTAARAIRVAKYRGAAHSANEFPFTLTKRGLEITASTLQEVSYPAATERVSSGIERLDSMLQGGYYRGSSILITGSPGTAKTSLSAAFSEAAAQRGERTLYVSFDESPEQIVRNVASIRIHLAPHIESGNLAIRSLRGRAQNPEAHAAQMRVWIDELRPRNFVLDPISALDQRGCGADAAEAAIHILDFAKSAGITIVSTSLLGNSVPLSEQTPLNISTIADTWMHLSYVNQKGERNRALTIIKARGTGHSNQVRELVLSDSGVTLADVYAVGGEVLMGTLRWERENEERRARLAARASASLREQKAMLALEDTNAQIDALARARAMQLAEIENLRTAAATEATQLAYDAEEHLTRRQADRSPSSAAITSGGTR